MKQRIQGIVIGLLIASIIFGGTAFASSSEMREIYYGINVVVNGVQAQFADDMRPFIMDNRTFLSLKAISDLLDIPVDFDPVTNSAIVGTRGPSGTRQPLNQAAPFYDSGGTGIYTRVSAIDSVNMGGTAYRDALVFGREGWSSSAFSLHNLNGQFRLLTGDIGRVDGTRMYNATFNFYGDGILLKTYEQKAGDLPAPISVFVEGVRQLKIEVITADGSALYALAGFLE